jgi:hypothetical protein
MRQSHCYDFTIQELASILAIPLAPLAVFALLTHLGVVLSIFPAPCPVLDTDRTILFHQADSARHSAPADVLLIGDSSCLMDVSAPQLTRSLPDQPAVLNLGTLSYLDLRGFATILSEYYAHHPKPPNAIVLLMHPEALRRPSPSEYHTDALQHFYSATDFCGPALSPVLCGLGVEIVRGRFIARCLPLPLGGAFGREYGFTWDLWNYLSAHQGSALDPGVFDPQKARGSAEYRLAPSWETASRSFRAVVPKDTQLLVGLTPVPESFVDASYQALHDRLLRTWSEWLNADRALDLPPVMPDHAFASLTHLNAGSVGMFTRDLSEQLRARSLLSH